MIDIVLDKKISVEYLTNVPIREWYKFSDEKYKRTDFLIKQYKF